MLIMSLNDFDREYLGQLLEWSPTVIVTDAVNEVTDSMAIKVDVVLSVAGNIDVQSSTRILNTGPNQLEDALKLLVSEEYPAVNIITDNFHTKDYALFIDFIDLVIYKENKRIFPVKPGFSKWRSAGEKVELLQEVTGLKIANLKHMDATVFETVKDGFYTLIFDQPFVFIAEEI